MAKRKSRKINRPTGITILSILYIILGIIVIGGMIASIYSYYAYDVEDNISLILSSGISIIGCILVFVTAYGLWNLKGWGHILAMILSVLALFIGVLMSISLTLGYAFAIWIVTPVSLGSAVLSEGITTSFPMFLFAVMGIMTIAMLIFHIYILWYLTRPHIKKVFK